MIVLILWYWLIRAAESAKVTVNVASQAGPDARSVDPTFCGFAFEERSFYLFAGPGGQPNTFTQNLIDAVASRTGVSPSIRVGGTSLDHSSYNADQQKAVVYPPGQSGRNVPANLTFGPSYFGSFANIPSAQFIFDIPLAKGNLSNALAFAEAGYSAIGSSRLEQLEVGNEPNYYKSVDRNVTYAMSHYVQEWGKYTNAICRRLGISCQSPMYEAATLASSKSEARWTIQKLFENGLSAYVNRIKSVSIHHYQTSANINSDLQRDLMNHTAVAVGSTQILEAVQYLDTHYPNIKVNLAEIGSALNPGANDYTLESVLGAALWQVDFLLYSMANGVNRVNYQLGIGFGFSQWLPINYRGMTASVKAPFYGHVFTADFIGRKGNVRVSNIDLGRDTLSAYAAYEAGQLCRLAVVNLDAASEPLDQREYEDVRLNLPTWVKSITVKRLTSPDGATANDTSRITWAGLSWTYESGGTQYRNGNDTKTLPVQSGVAVVRIYSSEALMIFTNQFP